MESRFITNNEMERIATTVLMNAEIPTTWQGVVDRIDIDSLIEFEYGLEIEWKNIDHLSRDGVVLAAITPKHKKIYMNDSQKDLFKEKMGTMNFSKAHELGHWVLHITEQKDYEQQSFEDNVIFYCRSFTKKSSIEIQADMFAGSLLMPKDIICGAVNQLKEFAKITWPMLYKLSDDFEVSISALTTRIRELKLLYISEDRKIYFNESEALGQMTLL